MGEIQDELPGVPERPNADSGLLVGLIVIGALVMAVIGVVVYLQWPDAADAEAGAFGGADVVILLEESFAVDEDGALSNGAQEMIADLEGRSGVDRVAYVGPAIVSGIVPDQPTLSAFGHELRVFGDGISFTASMGQIISDYVERVGVDSVEVP